MLPEDYPVFIDTLESSTPLASKRYILNSSECNSHYTDFFNACQMPSMSNKIIQVCSVLYVVFIQHITKL